MEIDADDAELIQWMALYVERSLKLDKELRDDAYGLRQRVEEQFSLNSGDTGGD